MSVFLTACATHTAKPLNVEQFLQPTRADSPYASLLELIDDPNSTTRALIDFAGSREDGMDRCNADKATTLDLLRKP